MMTTFRYIAIAVGLIVAVLAMGGAIINLGRMRKGRKTRFGKPMCIFLLIISVLLAIEVGVFLAI
nr:hypothetical protein [Maliibacterium massiliense]